jgi:thioredoxin-related protein
MAQKRLRLRLFFVLAILAWLTASPARSQAQATSATPAAARLDAAANLAADGRLARRQQLPILLFYSRDACPWCERARREQIQALARETPPRVIIRQIDIDHETALTDFAGKTSSHGALARNAKVRLAPTLSFVGPDGAPLAAPIVGYQSTDFYGAYIDRAIDEAHTKLRATPKEPTS